MTRVIGVPKEIKDLEGRVSMQPDGIGEVVHNGHEVVVETQAGTGAGFSDEEYEQAGARILDSADEVFDEADLIVKVKEPVPEEYRPLQRGPGALYLPAPRSRQRPHRVPDGAQDQLHRLRDSRVRRRAPCRSSNP